MRRNVGNSAKSLTENESGRWPAVPADRHIPQDKFPNALLNAVEHLDCKAFSANYQKWIDSGVLRDRSINFGVHVRLSTWYNKLRVIGAHGASGPMLPPSPRLPSEFLFDKTLSATDKMKLLALLAELWNYDRWAAERAAALKTVRDARADSDLIRRAVFWEPCDTNLVTAGSVAIEKLGTCSGETQQEDLVSIFLDKPLNSAAYYAIQKAIAANHKHVTDRLQNYAATHRDKAAQSIGRIYAAINNAALTNTLITWLTDSDPNIRREAAIDFCILPSTEAVSPLLKASATETNKEAKESMIEALAQIKDPRCFDLLSKALTKDASKNTQIQIARGFARLKDKRALHYLANLSSTADDEQIRWEAIKAFGYISGLFAAGPPDQFNSSSGMDIKTFTEGKKIVAQWK
jgi:HEAT repeat protein